jgi:hypothetical protein
MGTRILISQLPGYTSERVKDHLPVAVAGKMTPERYWVYDPEGKWIGEVLYTSRPAKLAPATEYGWLTVGRRNPRLYDRVDAIKRLPDYEGPK